VPAWLGRRAQIKWQIAEPVRAAVLARGLRADISCAPEAEFTGDAWYRFLLDCRVALGTESGASLLDRTGRIREEVEQFVRNHPTATPEEAAEACLHGADDSLDLFVLSPRHFDCCVTRTCQVLVEGRYSGVMLADRHYIPLRRDLGNLKDVLEQVCDVDHCQRIADRAFEDIVLSGRFEYGVFVRDWLAAVRPFVPVPSPPAGPRWARMALRERDRLTRALVRVREAALGLVGRPA
jgi:hypothetical protein